MAPLPDLDEPQRGDVIVLADASVEGEDIASILKARGFVVFDVPLALLEARVASEEPKLILVDVDQAGAIDKVVRLRKTPQGSAAQVFCLGDPLRAAELSDVSLADNVFERPVDIQRLVDRAVSVANPAIAGFSIRGTTPPPMYPARPSIPPESVPPISDFPRAQDPLEIGSFLDEGADPAQSLGVLAGAQVRLSPELAQQIHRAEERIRELVENAANLPAADEDADCPLPPEMLSQLDEPLDAVDDLEGTGGLAAALAQAGSSAGGSISIGPSALTPVPRASNTGITPLPEPGAFSRARTGHTQPNESALSPPGTNADAIVPPPHSVAASPRATSPAMGIRLGELLGLKPEDVKRTDTSFRGPVSQAIGSTSPNPLSAAMDSATQRGDELPPADLAHLSPLSPPVRFQEPRELAEGRAVFDPRTIPPRPAGRVPPEVHVKQGPIVVPPSVSAGFTATAPRAATDREEGVSPQAASVHPPAREASSIGSFAAVFAEGEGLRPLAKAVAARLTGCLATTVTEGTRRVVLLDGDIVTASSEINSESLTAFLAGRGDLSRDVAARLEGKLPASGRHAGAALIAQGYLAQNDLWPVLRAHAEWLIGKLLVSGPGSTEVDDDIPARLKAEPNVFGGATGAEVFVETARRVLDPAKSLAALDPAARVDAGARQALLAECALSSDEDARVRAAAGKSIAELVGQQGADFASVVRALVELDVIALLAPARKTASAKPGELDPLDEEAVRQKVRAKMVLVREGDYFALLGVNRAATSYEVKRAFLELRRSFEPSRLLTPHTVDLHDEVALILEVVEEAYEILKDERRRDRYRRAIEAGPPE